MRDVPDYAVIIRCIHERGASQREALRELGRRGLWLTDDQKAAAALVEGKAPLMSAIDKVLQPVTGPYFAPGTPAMSTLEVMVDKVGLRNVLYALEIIADRQGLLDQQKISAMRQAVLK